MPRKAVVVLHLLSLSLWVLSIFCMCQTSAIVYSVLMEVLYFITQGMLVQYYLIWIEAIGWSNGAWKFSFSCGRCLLTVKKANSYHWVLSWLPGFFTDGSISCHGRSGLRERERERVPPALAVSGEVGARMHKCTLTCAPIWVPILLTYNMVQLYRLPVVVQDCLERAPIQSLALECVIQSLALKCVGLSASPLKCQQRVTCWWYTLCSNMLTVYFLL